MGPAELGAGVEAELLGLLGRWSHTPALIIDPLLDVPARNDLAAALYAGFRDPGNLARMTFADPAGLEFFADYRHATESCVAHLRRAEAGPRLDALVGELSAASSAFAKLWARSDVREPAGAVRRFCHPEVGAIDLDVRTFDVPDAPGLELVVCSAAPGSPSADKLALLGSLSATAATEK